MYVAFMWLQNRGDIQADDEMLCMLYLLLTCICVQIKTKQRDAIKDPDDEFRGIAAKDMSKAHHVPDENVWDYLPAVEVRAVLLELFSTIARRATVNTVVSSYEKAPLPFL